MSMASDPAFFTPRLRHHETLTDEDGQTELKRLTEYGLHKTLSPYNAYRQGKLGKLPFTGSIFLEPYE